MSDPVRELLDEQIAYYRARAAEYEATSTPEGDPFASSADRIRVALRRAEPRGRVLELAAGTGHWTGLLAETATELTALDSSPEMLRLNRKRNGAAARYVVADAFELSPSPAFDVVFFGFFLSHVPPSRFEAFWTGVAGQLAPCGRALFVDEGHHSLWREDWVDENAGIVCRTLEDGSPHRAVKVLWKADDLEARLTGLGWNASVTAEGPFYWAVAAVVS